MHVREVDVVRRSLYREYGYYIPFNPAVKALEFISFPVYLGIGTALLYRYWTFDEASTGTAAANDTGPAGTSSDTGSFVGTASRTVGLLGTGMAVFASIMLIAPVGAGVLRPAISASASR